MQFEHVLIEATGMAQAPHILSSDALEQKLVQPYTRLKLPFGRIELQTGIKARGYWDPGTLPSEIATIAARDCLERSHITKDDIDLLIFSSVCRDQLEPSSASSVHQNLGLKDSCQSFDLSNACLGFMSAMIQAACQIELGIIENALIVSGENSGPLILKTIETLIADHTISRKDFKKYFANLTIGSAGVAMVLSRRKDQQGLQLKSALSKSDTSAANLCRGGGDNNALVMETDSEKLLIAGVELAQKAWQEFGAGKNFDHFITHQVGIAHRNLLYDKLHLPLAHDFSTFDQYGNTGSAAVILTLHKFLNQRTLTNNSKVAMLGIGSGLHTIMMELVCNK